MQTAGLPSPEYKQSEFMLYATLKNKTWGLENSTWESLTTGEQVSDQAGGQVSDQVGEGDSVQGSDQAGDQVSVQIDNGAVTSEQANKRTKQANKHIKQVQLY